MISASVTKDNTIKVTISNSDRTDFDESMFEAVTNNIVDFKPTGIKTVHVEKGNMVLVFERKEVSK